MTALAANKRARLAEQAGERVSGVVGDKGGVRGANEEPNATIGTGEDPGARATFGRIEVAPNGVNAIASRVTAWLDARAADEGTLRALVDVIVSQAHDRAARDGTTLDVTAESVTPAVTFDAGLRDRLARRLGNPPALPTQAGHDAGILATAGVPTAMLFVRNPTGLSHSPAEHADPADCLAGVHALADVLEELLT
jgi:beta-ureidopropionase / N-carbamoyl-L-amino-acid hydrolase